MKVNPKVPTVKFEGRLSKVVEQVTEFEDAFNFLPMTEPEVPHYRVLTNEYGGDHAFYTFVSDDYHLLRTSDTLKALADSLAEDPVATAYIGKRISVEIKFSGLPALFIVNSYEKSLREQIVVSPLMLSFNYVHRQSGEVKQGFNEILDLFQNTTTMAAALENLKTYTINGSDFKAFVRHLNLSPISLAKGIFGVEYKEAKEILKLSNNDPAAALWHYYNQSSTYKNNLAGLIGFSHAVYHFYTKRNNFDRAATLVGSMSNFITNNHIKTASVFNLL